MIAFMISGATFRPNPKHVRHYLYLSTFMVWNGHNDSWTLTWRYALLRSSKDSLEPFCHHARSLAVQTSALAVHVSTWWLSSQKSITGRILDLFFCSRAIRVISPLGGPSFSSGNGTSQPLLNHAHNPLISPLLPDTPTPHCAVLQAWGPLTTSMPELRLSSDGQRWQWSQVH